MDKEIIASVDSEVYSRFCIALDLTNKTQDEAITECLRWYISKAFGKVSQEYSHTSTTKNDTNFYGKANQKIPMWALKTNQYNHKIIKAYFMALDIAGEATLSMLERLYSDENRPDLYVPTFKSNYSQMKLDGIKTHGKVFEDDGNLVWIWKEVEDTLLKHKNSFYNGEE